MKFLDFDKEGLSHYINYELGLGTKLKKSFNFVVKELGEQEKHKISKLKWREGKNYNWAVLINRNVKMLIRSYRNHYTFFTLFNHPEKEYKSEFAIFTYYSDIDLLTPMQRDLRIYDDFIDIDESIDIILETLNNGEAHWIWNNSSVPRPDHIKIKTALVGERIFSFDLLVFAAEELASLEVELFAENHMLHMIEKVKPGDVIGRYTVKSIHLDIKNGYHDVGIIVYDDNSFKDVYSLTMYYLNDIMKIVEPQSE